MINYGILSTASITKRFVSGIRNSQDGFVYAIASRNIEKAKAKAEELNIEKYYGSYEELYNDKNIDVIYIPTTNITHYRYAKEALEHQKNVILEKPFTLSENDAIDLFETARKNNCFLMEGQKSLFLPTTIKAKELIKNNVIGKINYIETSMSHPSRHVKGNWMYNLYQGGGALNGSGPYPIEFSMFLLDKTDFSINASFIQGEETADNLVVFQISDNQTIINNTVSMDVSLPNRAIIYGEKGHITIENYWKATRLILCLEDKEEVFEYPTVSEFVYEVNHVNECIKNKMLTSNVVTSDITINCVKYIQKMYHDFYTLEETHEK